MQPGVVRLAPGLVVLFCAFTAPVSAAARESIEAQIDPANDASRVLLLKVGFTQEGYFRENFYDDSRDQFSDTAVFSLLASDFIEK